MNAKDLLRIAVLAAIMAGGAFASAADLADYLSDSTARPRRGTSTTSNSADDHSADLATDDLSGDADDLSDDAKDSDLDIPAIPPKMPTLEHSSKGSKSDSSSKVASRLRADELPSVAAKSTNHREPGRLPNELPSRAARQSVHGARSSAPASANYAPGAADKGTGIRTTSGSSYYGSPYGASRAPMNRTGQSPYSGQRTMRTAWAPQGNYDGSVLSGRDRNASMEPTPALTQEPEPESIEAGSPMPSDDSPMYGDGMMYGGPYPPGDCATCGPECGPVASCAPCYGSWCKGWYAGADVLVLRPRFSADTAYIQRVESQQSTADTVTETVRHQSFDFDAGVRVFVGYRFCNCDGQVQFTYWNYNNNESTITPPATDEVTYLGQLLINADDPDEQLGIQRNLEFNVYDLDYSRCIPLGDCNSCCPPWSMTYTVGVRIADVNRSDNNALFFEGESALDRGFISSDFTGAGPRVGVEGRRFFCGGCGSLFVRSYFSLLVGTLDIEATRVIGDSEEENVFIGRYVDSHTRVIPVGEIELGGSYQITRRLTLSAGYMVQAWWDLGAFEQISPAESISAVPPDTANILGLDGAFFRLEMCF